MTRIHLGTWMCLFALTACDGDKGTTPTDTDDTELVETDPADTEETDAELDGAALFASACEACHGQDGTGSVSGPDITGEAQRDEADLLDVILQGEGMMPPAPVNEAEARAIIAFIRETF